MIRPRPSLLPDPFRIRWPRLPQPLEEAGAAVAHDLATAVRDRRRRDTDLVMQSLKHGAQLRREEQAAVDLRRRRALAIAKFTSLKTEIENNWAVTLRGFVPYARPFRHATQKGVLPRRSMFAEGCFDKWVRRGANVELMVEHDGRALRLVDKLRVTALPGGIYFTGRVAHDDPGLARIKSMREVSPGYRVLASTLDQYVNEDYEEVERITEAALDELSFVPASANPGSWFAVTDPRERAAAS